MSSIIKRFASIFGAKTANLILGIAITPLLVRALGSGNYGDFAFLLSLIGITMTIANAGIFDGVRKYIAEQRDNPDWTANVFGYYLRIAATLIGVTTVGYWSFAYLGFAEHLFGTSFDIYFYMVGVMLIAQQFNTLSRGGLMGFGLEERSEPLVVLQKLIFGVGAVGLALLGYGVVGALIGSLLADATVTLIGFAILARRMDVREIFSAVPPGFPRRELLTFNGMSVVLIFTMASLYHVDILLLQPLAGSDQAGFYKAALVIAEFLWFAPRALQTVLLQSSSEMWANEDAERVSELVSKLTRFNVIFTSLLVLGLGSLAADFVPLYYGPDFTNAILPLLLLLPGTFGLAITRPIMAVGQGKGTLRPLIVATGAAAAINLGLNLLLIPRYGMVGAGVATSVGYGSMLVFHGIAARRIGYDPFRDLRLPRIAVTAGLSAPVIVGLSLAIPHSIVSLVVVPPVGFVVYGVLALRTRAIDVDELDPLTERVPEPFDAWVSRTLQIVA